MTEKSEAQRKNAELQSPADRFGARLAARPSATQLKQRIIRQERETITEFFDAAENDESIARAAAIIVAARRRFVTGAGRSEIFARLLEADLSLGLAQVSLVDDTHVRVLDVLDVLTDVRTTDVLIAFSMRRYRPETTRFLEQYAVRGGKIVVVADSQSSPLVRFATESIIVSTRSASYADSGTAVVAASQLLAALTTASAKGARRRLAEREVLSEALGIYGEQ